MRLVPQKACLDSHGMPFQISWFAAHVPDSTSRLHAHTSRKHKMEILAATTDPCGNNSSSESLLINRLLHLRCRLAVICKGRLGPDEYLLAATLINICRSPAFFHQIMPCIKAAGWRSGVFTRIDEGHRVLIISKKFLCESCSQQGRRDAMKCLPCHCIASSTCILAAEFN